MNNKLSIPYFILIIASLAFGCRGPVNEENKGNATANALSAGQKHHIDLTESVVTWKGSNSFGSHTGYVSISKGALTIDNGQLVGGSAEVDMNTIEDETHSSDSGLIKHLKDPDFFDVKKFPVATIVLTRAASINGENKKVIGNLTIKGVTHPVAFPAKMEFKDGIVTLTGTLVIDRTKWNVRYKSGKFFDLLADQTISDSIEFNVKIVAKKLNI